MNCENEIARSGSRIVVGRPDTEISFCTESGCGGFHKIENFVVVADANATLAIVRPSVGFQEDGLCVVQIVDSPTAISRIPADHLDKAIIPPIISGVFILISAYILSLRERRASEADAIARWCTEWLAALEYPQEIERRRVTLPAPLSAKRIQEIVSLHSRLSTAVADPLISEHRIGELQSKLKQWLTRA